LAGEGFKKDFCWFDRKKVSTKLEDDFDLDGVKLKTTQRFASGIRNYTHIQGNTGS